MAPANISDADAEYLFTRTISGFSQTLVDRQECKISTSFDGFFT